jgi:hypothetical protein
MRHVRVSDELWVAAQEAVRLQGDPSVSAVIREALAQYVRAAERRRKAGTLPAQNRGANRIVRKHPPPR